MRAALGVDKPWEECSHLVDLVMVYGGDWMKEFDDAVAEVARARARPPAARGVCGARRARISPLARRRFRAYGYIAPPIPFARSLTGGARMDLAAHAIARD